MTESARYYAFVAIWLEGMVWQCFIYKFDVKCGIVKFEDAMGLDYLIYFSLVLVVKVLLNPKIVDAAFDSHQT